MQRLRGCRRGFPTDPQPPEPVQHDRLLDQPAVYAQARAMLCRGASRGRPLSRTWRRHFCHGHTRGRRRSPLDVCAVGRAGHRGMAAISGIIWVTSYTGRRSATSPADLVHLGDHVSTGSASHIPPGRDAVVSGCFVPGELPAFSTGPPPSSTGSSHSLADQDDCGVAGESCPLVVPA
jgi:hypothetical protein